MMAHELLHQAALIVAAGWMKNENAGVSGLRNGCRRYRHIPRMRSPTLMRTP